MREWLTINHHSNEGNSSMRTTDQPEQFQPLGPPTRLAAAPAQAPHQDQMRPFEWLELACKDLGREDMAAGVRELIQSRATAMESAKWQGARRLEVEAELNAMQTKKVGCFVYGAQAYTLRPPADWPLVTVKAPGSFSFFVDRNCLPQSYVQGWEFLCADPDITIKNPVAVLLAVLRYVHDSHLAHDADAAKVGADGGAKE